MNKLFLPKIIIVVIFLLATILTGIASAAIDGKGSVNGQDVDNATSSATAISIKDVEVNGSWAIENSGSSPVTLSKVIIDYAGFLPDREFDFSETINPGGTNDGSGSITLPDFVLALKGYYNVKVTAYDESGKEAISRTFWVTFGEGSPLTGVVGGTGAALAALALLTGIASAVKNGKWLRRISTVLALSATPFLLIGFGAISPLQTAAFLGTTVGVCVADNLLIRLLSKVFSK